MDEELFPQIIAAHLSTCCVLNLQCLERDLAIFPKFFIIFCLLIAFPENKDETNLIFILRLCSKLPKNCFSLRSMIFANKLEKFSM